jgi:hypothetical protein
MVTAAGYAAIGAAEGLLHAYDIATGLDLDWSPGDGLARAVVDAVFPQAPGTTPWDRLLAATGRGGVAPERWTYAAAADQSGRR